MDDYVARLKERNYVVEYATGPAAALMAARTLPSVTLIVLDIMMPAQEQYAPHEVDDGILTGLPLFRELVEQCPYTPVVVFTNCTRPEVKKRFFGMLAVDVLAKLDYSPKKFSEYVTHRLATPVWFNWFEATVDGCLGSDIADGQPINISLQIADQAKSAIRGLCKLNTPKPRVVSLAGGIRLEWQLDNGKKAAFEWHAKEKAIFEQRIDDSTNRVELAWSTVKHELSRTIQELKPEPLY